MYKYLLLLFSLTACAALTPFLEASFVLNETYTVNVGEKILSIQTGDILVTDAKTGINEVLIYNGTANKILHITYREFAIKPGQQLARDAFNQSFQYDLNETKIIRYKDLQIEIIKATSSQLTFKVIAWERENMKKELEKNRAIEQKYKETEWK
ncbi:MAG: hypothetical protein RBS48_04915 [Ignavibacteriaceae bacterium]|jgi:hypothetical protein|nr:hypothetical protein [Ignavibacteriaceae bacterium]